MSYVKPKLERKEVYTNERPGAEDTARGTANTCNGGISMTDNTKNEDDYKTFVDSKLMRDRPKGMDEVADINNKLYDWQQAVVRWALKRGRAAIFADCGLGKTPMQLEWANRVRDEESAPVLIVAPLAVCEQTCREAEKFGIDQVHTIRSMTPVDDNSIAVVNYEMLDVVDPDQFAGVVLDESSILKAYDGKTRNQIVNMFSETPWRLACTATPAPNDHMELTNHAEFLGVMERQEVLASFFTHDSSETQQWRLKGHAEDEFWRWMASWAVSMTDPSDLGYEDDRFDLPPIDYEQHIVEVDRSQDAPEGMIFRPQATGLREIQQEQSRTVEDRAERVAELANGDGEQWIVWCNRNAESREAAKRIDGAVEVRGSHDPQTKAERMKAFADAGIRVLVTKPSIAGFGMNWQHCRNVAFVGLSYSYEQFYQALRRCWRFGQSREVRCHVVVAETEGQVLQSIRSKQRKAERMHKKMSAAMSEVDLESAEPLRAQSDDYATDVEKGDGYRLYLGDCVEIARENLDDESVGLSVFSPPFSSLYTYSASPRDMGNCSGDEEFFEHFGYLIDELYRATMPGRICAVHCSNLTTTKAFDGQIGIRDFRGDVIRAFRDKGWVFHSEVTIWKDPVTAMQRTKALGLLYKQLRKDSCMSRQGLPDYLLAFRKPGENPEPVDHTEKEFPLEEWQKLASPTWRDIDQTDVLDYREAREEDDEKHICPLQLEVIERALKLWSNEGDLVYDPFTGIGSTGYVALDKGRKFVGSELKQSYYEQASRYLHDITTPDRQLSIMGAAE
jgi:DNA modification methylase/superfamily II DNA or RNA helicase